MFKRYLMMFDDAAAGGGEAPKGPTTWDAYIASLPEETRATVTALYESQNAALLNSVKATRQERDTFASELRDAAKKLEKGSAAQTELLEKATALDEANRRADFYEAAPAQECRNPKAAFALAKASNLFLKSGLPDWKAIKEEAPELFGVVTKPKGKGAAGAGTEQQDKPTSINQFIRAKAGIRPSE